VKGEPIAFLHGHAARLRNVKHGLCRRGNRLPEHAVYSTARQRCTNPKDKDFYLYGGRGIKFLFTSFEQFFAELGKRPKGRSLDREDNDGNYEPGNVRWATKRQQDANKRKWGTCRKRYPQN
jgi:hypothetical protein